MTGTMLALMLSATPIQVVVTDVRVEGGVEAAKGALVGEEVAKALPPEAYRVTTASQLASVLGLEKQRQLLGCDGDGSCAAELASALGAEIVVQVAVRKLDTGLRCDVVFISGREGTALERVSAEGKTDAALLERLHEEVEAAATRVFTRRRPGNTLEAGRPGFRRYAWAPALAGAALVGGGAVLFGITDQTWRTLNSRDGRVEDAQALADSGRTTQTAGWVLCSVGAAALVTSAAMLVFGAPTEARVMVAPVVSGGGGGLMISGALP